MVLFLRVQLGHFAVRGVANWALTLAALLVLGGCLETEFGPAIGDGGGPDLAQLSDGQGDGAATADSSAGSDALGDTADAILDVPDADAGLSCPGIPGCSCKNHGDCAAGACVQTAAGKRCAAFCVEGNCDPGAVCGALAIDIPGAATATKFGICLPRWPTDCVACKDNSACANPADPLAACVDPTGSPAASAGAAGWFCAASCKQDADCSPGRKCKTSAGRDGKDHQACVPTDGNCSCSPLAIDVSATTDCFNTGVSGGAGAGICKGVRICQSSGLSACSAAVPKAEVCNGADDDCDGSIDESSDATPICDDQQACTTDSCGGKGGCVHLPTSVTCSDDDPCTGPDGCEKGKCTGGKLDCGDGNPCTADSCAQDSGCSYAAVNGGCDDGDKCSLADQCLNGQCVGGKSATCDDANPCTNDWCDPAKGCTALPNDATCTDNNACTGADFCKDGGCFGPALVCDDGWGCTLDSCDPAGGCSFKPTSSGCGQAQVPYALAMDCSETGFEGWRVTAPGVGLASPQPPLVAWKLDDQPAMAGAGQCTLNINNGKDLACGWGQNQIEAYADSPWLDLMAVSGGSALVLRFESAGLWGSSWSASVQMREQGQAWKPLIVKIDPSGALWGKVSLNVPQLAGKLVQLRFQFISAGCSDSSGTGWFLRKLSLAVDPCVNNNGGCASTALCSVGGDGSAICTCKAGYSGNGKSCSDIDECKNPVPVCAAGKTCTNTPGGYTCGCPAGFTGDGTTCTDINECANGTAGCASTATCTNTQGSFSCTCKSGYSGNGKVCTDINECAVGLAGCATSTQATCTNLPGSFQCACNAGYTGNGKTCTDVNECAVGLADCATATAATCTNVPGSFTCACKPGFVGSGKTCQFYGSLELPAPSCKAIKTANAAATSGLYWLSLAGSLVQVTCDMVTDGGGWTLVTYKSDLAMSSWNKGPGWQWLAVDFQTALTVAQIKALQAVSTEGRQTYVGQCSRQAHYLNAQTNQYDRAFGFRFVDGSISVNGKQSYLPLDITVPSDACKSLSSGTQSTVFSVKSVKVPIVNVFSMYALLSGKFGSPLTQNPAMLR